MKTTAFAIFLMATAVAACTREQPTSATTAESATAAAVTATAAAMPATSPAPERFLGGIAAAMSSSAVTASCTTAPLSATNSGVQNAQAFLSAAASALASTSGNLCLPPGVFPFATVTLTQAHAGLHTIGTAPTQKFLYNQPSLGYTLGGGTILAGSGGGSGAAFRYVGPGGSANTWATGFLTGVSFENIGFDNWDRQFLFGGTNLQGVSYSKFDNLYGTHINVRAYDFINVVSLWIDNLYGYFAGSGFRMADDLDALVYGSTTNSYIGNLQFTLTGFASEGIVLEATAIGGGGSQLNEIWGGYWFVERPAMSPQLQSARLSAGSSLIGISNNSYLPIGMPVGFTASGDGFVANQTYFIVSSTPTAVQISNTYGGTPVTATGNAAMTLKAVGGENIALRGLGTEVTQNHGTISNVHIELTDSENATGNCVFLQGVSGAQINLGECSNNVISGVALRGSNGVTITNGGSTNPTRDADGWGNLDNTWIGAYSAPDVQSDGFVGAGQAVAADGSVTYHLGLAPSLEGMASPGFTVRGSQGSFLYSDFGIGQPYHADGAVNPMLNAGMAGIYAYAGPGGTCTLPSIVNPSYTASLIGLPYWITNVGSGPCRIVTQGAQTFSGQAGVTSITLPVGGTAALSAEPLGGGFSWHVLSMVQPSQVRYGTLSLPTTTVASLPPCTTAQAGLLYSVSDAQSPTYNAIVQGGGTLTIPVFCNGVHWTSH
jgi:hypothetical protein